MKLIPLTQGQFAMVDDEDFDFLSQWKWYVHKQRHMKYAKRGVKEPKTVVSIAMHRLLMGLPAGDKRCVDHIDRNGLNNQKENLKVCSIAENQYNREKIKKKTSSKFIGVSRSKGGKWESNIRHKGRRINLGTYNNEDDASAAYNNAKLKYHGTPIHPICS